MRKWEGNGQCLYKQKSEKSNKQKQTNKYKTKLRKPTGYDHDD